MLDLTFELRPTDHSHYLQQRGESEAKRIALAEQDNGRRHRNRYDPRIRQEIEDRKMAMRLGITLADLRS